MNENENHIVTLAGEAIWFDCVILGKKYFFIAHIWIAHIFL